MESLISEPRGIDWTSVGFDQTSKLDENLALFLYQPHIAEWTEWRDRVNTTENWEHANNIFARVCIRVQGLPSQILPGQGLTEAGVKWRVKWCSILILPDWRREFQIYTAASQHPTVYRFQGGWIFAISPAGLPCRMFLSSNIRRVTLVSIVGGFVFF